MRFLWRTYRCWDNSKIVLDLYANNNDPNMASYRYEL